MDHPAPDPRQLSLLRSLRQRYQAAIRAGDRKAKQDLFREAVYLNIQPALLEGEADQVVASSGVIAS